MTRKEFEENCERLRRILDDAGCMPKEKTNGRYVSFVCRCSYGVAAAMRKICQKYNAYALVICFSARGTWCEPQDAYSVQFGVFNGSDDPKGLEMRFKVLMTMCAAYLSNQMKWRINEKTDC